VPRTEDPRANLTSGTSLPLDRSRRLARDIVHDPVDVADFVDDAAGDFVEDVVGDLGVVGGHEVGGGDAAEGQKIVVGAAVAHDADGAKVGEDGKILVDVAVEAGGADLLAEDRVGVAKDGEF